MRIKKAEFIKGIIGTDHILDDATPHVAFVGRSNVGKSSVINSLLEREDLAKSSSTPGKTQQINFFRVVAEDGAGNLHCLYLADLPGYGFAKVSDKKREKLRKLILWYLEKSPARPKHIVLIVDCKIGPTQFDKEMVEVLKKGKHPFIVVANKIDKVRKNDVQKQILHIGRVLEVGSVIPYSARERKGREELLSVFFNKEG